MDATFQQISQRRADFRTAPKLGIDGQLAVLKEIFDGMPKMDRQLEALFQSRDKTEAALKERS